MVWFSLNSKAILPSPAPQKSHVVKDPEKFPITEALIFRVFYLAYKDTALIVMTTGHGAHF